MAKRLDLTGQRFGRLTVIGLNKEVTKQKRGAHWNCKCDCGNEKVVWASDLRRGKTTSCGCYRKEKTKEKWQDEEFRQIQSNKARAQMEEQWQDKEFRQTQSDKMKEQWQDNDFREMQSDRMSRDGNPHWNGGITPISTYLRDLQVIKQWRKDTYTRENSRCQLTGKKVHGGNSDVHHLYGFNIIVVEAHTINNIEIKPQVKDYTEEELHKLEEYVTNWHKDTSNAVLLSKEVHELFHNCKDKDGNVLYGYGNNTPEQFEEFKQRYLNGEFNDLI